MFNFLRRQNITYDLVNGQTVKLVNGIPVETLGEGNVSALNGIVCGVWYDKKTGLPMECDDTSSSEVIDAEVSEEPQDMTEWKEQYRLTGMDEGGGSC